MVRELITINLGQAGLQLSQSVWQQYCCEHGISNDGHLKESSKMENNNTTTNSLSCFFSQTNSGIWTPRNISIDTEPNVIDDIKNSNLSKLFNKNYFIHGSEDAANNFARGKYSIGREMIDNIKEKIRKLMNECDNCQGFILNHSVGGGTGSGLGDLVLENLHTYKSKTTLGFEIYPSETISTCVVEPYNAVFATGCNLYEHCNDFISFMMDNEQLYKICKKNLNIKHPSYGNINRLISKGISSLTASVRFEGELNLDITDLKTNLVPYPGLHFMISSMAPILTPNKMETFKCDARTLTDACFHQSNFYVNIPDFNNEEDKYLAALIMYRGSIHAKEANEATQWLVKNDKCNFVDWIPCKFKLCLNNKSSVTLSNNNDSDNDIHNNNNNKEDLGLSESTALMVGNNVGIGKVFNNVICKKFDLMYDQRAFVHWFVGEGLEEGEFKEARENLGYLEQNYLDAANDINDENENEIETETDVTDDDL